MKKILFTLVMICVAISINAQNSLLADRLHLYVEGLAATYVDKPDFVDGSALVGGAVTAGYQLNNNLNLGLGLSPAYVDVWPGETGWAVPIYAQARLDNTLKRVSPYGELRLGASIYDFNGHSSSAFYLNGSVGVRYRRVYLGAFYTEDINSGHSGYIGGKIGVVL